MSAYASVWQPDRLFPDYQARTVEQGTDYDGTVRSTIVRKLANCPGSRKGVLYIHGFNDYFLQDDMGRRLADSCYNFYAVDLRRYGRSLREGDPRFDIRDMHEYFPDIDSAIVEMKRQGIDTIVLMGHSTGGLTTSLYLSEKHDPAIKALILNSPFLDWNQSALQERVLIPIVQRVGRLFPTLTVMSGADSKYKPSGTVRTEHGTWKIDCDWKPKEWLQINAGWIRAIDRAHDAVQNKPDIQVPILLMHSDRTWHDGDRKSLRDSSDTVLDVADISHYGRKLGREITEATVKGGTHDLVRSAPGIREAVYRTIFDWLKRKKL
jgi:alpha-beta hydrolase superfamily lysophospholipase